MNRRKLNQRERREVYNKCRGHCAYCGCKLEYVEMQVDHVISLAHHNGKDEIENMLPACRSCNHYKHTMTLERFREAVEAFPSVLERDSVTYKNALRFGVIEAKPHKVKFYFEKVKTQEVK